MTVFQFFSSLENRFTCIILSDSFEAVLPALRSQFNWTGSIVSWIKHTPATHLINATLTVFGFLSFFRSICVLFGSKNLF